MDKLANIFTINTVNKVFTDVTNNVSSSAEYGGNTLTYISRGKLYSTIYVQLANYFRIIKELKKDDIIVDIGCGCGELFTVMRENLKGNPYVGFEINDTNINKLKKKLKKPDREKLIKYDVTLPLPIKTNTVNICTANFLLEHMSRDSAFSLFREMVRIVKENGLILITLPIRKDGEENERQKHIYEWHLYDIDDLLKEIDNVILEEKYMCKVKIHDILNSRYKDIYIKLKSKINPIFIGIVFAPLFKNKGRDIFLKFKKVNNKLY